MDTASSKKGADHSAPFSFGPSRMGPRDEREDDGDGEAAVVPRDLLC